MIVPLLLLGGGADSLALGYNVSDIEHRWAVGGPGGTYGIIQFAPYSPGIKRRTIVMFAGRSQEIPMTAPWAAALLGIVALSVGVGVLSWRQRKT